MTTYFEDKIIDFFSKARTRFNKKETLSFSDLEYLFENSIEFLSTTYPNDSLRRYFIVPEIIQLLLYEINNSGLKTIESRNIIREDLDQIIKKLPIQKKHRFIKFRILDKNGYYPNCDLIRNGLHYSTINQIPILCTINNYQQEYGYPNYSEITWATRKELQIATCILLTPDSGIPMIYFTDYNHIELNEKSIHGIPTELKIYFLFELLQLQNRFKPIDSHYIEREPIQDITSYMYFEFSDYKTIFNKLLDSFSIRDQLLLRTTNFLVKSSMLWKNRTFGEEAVENVCFALEGCLHLLQKQFGDNSKKLNRVLVKKIFINNWQNGENLYDFIEEAYYNRISLIHPEPDWGANWKPFLKADDFYDYFNICREILNFILIKRSIEY